MSNVGWGSQRNAEGRANPYAGLSAPATQPGVSRPPVMTQFSYEGWTIYFQEQEPFSWYVSHGCSPVWSSNTDRVYLDNKAEVIEEPLNKEENTEIRCNICKAYLPKYTYLILRRTQKFMNFGKRAL